MTMTMKQGHNLQS